MKLFIKRSLYFLLPLVIFITMIVLVDPYNYYRRESFIPNNVKLETSYKFHYPLWKLSEYNRYPIENILLGDSRTDALGTSAIEEKTKTKWYNLAYGGSTVPEIIETFWYADKQTKLKKVYIGLNFNLFNSYKRMDRATEAKNIIDEPLLYPFNKTVVKAFFYNIYYAATGGDPEIGKPTMRPEEFWKFQLDRSAANYYSPFKFADDFMQGLRDIASHCKKYNIELVFFIPPTHIDLQKRIDDFGLRQTEIRWKKTLQEIAPVIDMDVPNDFTSDPNNFKDPYHLKEPAIVMESLFGG